jgi:hypothetical protein
MTETMALSLFRFLSSMFGRPWRRLVTLCARIRFFLFFLSFFPSPKLGQEGARDWLVWLPETSRVGKLAAVWGKCIWEGRGGSQGGGVSITRSAYSGVTCVQSRLGYRHVLSTEQAPHAKEGRKDGRVAFSSTIPCFQLFHFSRIFFPAGLACLRGRRESGCSLSNQPLSSASKGGRADVFLSRWKDGWVRRVLKGGTKIRHRNLT